jgi:Protein of unknown function (DUF1264)
MARRVPRRESPVRPPGRPKGAWLAALEQGAKLLRDSAPLRGFHAYVVGFHCAKGEPGMQMEAHHYCRVVNDDFLQCVLFDGNTRDANLIGIEYIVSGELFATLPEEERASWHPHNYEVLSGELVAPGLPEPAERAFLRRLLNSYGKTWHTWHTGRHDGAPGTPLPIGEPKLMWSFNREGEAEESLKRNRDEHFGIDVPLRRERRQRALLRSARPQQGVDDMKDDFSGTDPVRGVVDVRAAAP